MKPRESDGDKNNWCYSSLWKSRISLAKMILYPFKNPSSPPLWKLFCVGFLILQIKKKSLIKWLRVISFLIPVLQMLKLGWMSISYRETALIEWWKLSRPSSDAYWSVQAGFIIHSLLSQIMPLELIMFVLCCSIYNLWLQSEQWLRFRKQK